MDEYKFRGYDIIGNKWVYGDLVHNKKVTKEGLEPRVMVGGYEVDPNSAGLCTGMEDDNCKEMYVGDIVKITKEDYPNVVFTSPIVFEYGACQVFFYKECKESLVDYINDYIEVIGNVYQNKELLE